MLLERLRQQHREHRRAPARWSASRCSLDQREPAGRRRTSACSTDGPGSRGVQAGDRDHAGRRRATAAAAAGPRLRPGVAAGVEPARPAASQVRVAEHDALGPAGRAAGVEQRGEVVAARGRRAASGVAVLELGVRPACPSGRHVADDDDAQAEAPAAACTLGRNSGVVTTATAPESASTCRSSSSLSRNSTGVGDRAGPPERAVGDADLGAVGHADDDPVARPRRRARRSPRPTRLARSASSPEVCQRALEAQARGGRRAARARPRPVGAGWTGGRARVTAAPGRSQGTGRRDERRTGPAQQVGGLRRRRGPAGSAAAPRPGRRRRRGRRVRTHRALGLVERLELGREDAASTSASPAAANELRLRRSAGRARARAGGPRAAPAAATRARGARRRRSARSAPSSGRSPARDVGERRTIFASSRSPACGPQRLHVGEVAEDGAQRDPGAGGDALGGRARGRPPPGARAARRRRRARVRQSPASPRAAASDCGSAMRPSGEPCTTARGSAVSTLLLASTVAVSTTTTRLPSSLSSTPPSTISGRAVVVVGDDDRRLKRTPYSTPRRGRRPSR